MKMKIRYYTYYNSTHQSGHNNILSRFTPPPERKFGYSQKRGAAAWDARLSLDYGGHQTVPARVCGNGCVKMGEAKRWDDGRRRCPVVSTAA